MTAFTRGYISRTFFSLLWLCFPWNTELSARVIGNPLANIPQLLSSEDRAKYQKIFLSQEKGRWRNANRIIAKLENPVLMGHVLAQRYLHPTKYRSKYKELELWLESYRDHPDARRIYKLAIKRRPSRKNRPQVPLYQTKNQLEEQNNRRYGTYYRLKIAGIKVTKKTKNFHRQVRKLVFRQRLTKAGKFVDLAERRGISKGHVDLARARIAAGWFYYGNDQQTLKISKSVIERNGTLAPSAWWYGGLSAFRAGKYLRAAKNFQALVSTEGISDIQRTAAAFWAGRSNMVAKRPQNTSQYLRIAAESKRDFYGILARRILGVKTSALWTSSTTKALPHLKRILKHPVTKRSLALVEIGQIDRAERDLKQLLKAATPKTRRVLVAAGEFFSMPSLALQAARGIKETLTPDLLRGLYPIPKWVPKDGFSLDRALIFAFIRQESAFRVRAMSHAGAVGLMQLMPRTASYISGRKYHGRRKSQLFNPVLNITLGQKYLRYLLNHESVKGNVLLLAAAYNGGPGNLKKWKRRVGVSGDPLLLIESLPSGETRHFIERVMANLWIYRDRLGQDSPTLKALAEGLVPINEALDKKQRN